MAGTQPDDVLAPALRSPTPAGPRWRGRLGTARPAACLPVAYAASSIEIRIALLMVGGHSVSASSEDHDGCIVVKLAAPTPRVWIIPFSRANSTDDCLGSVDCLKVQDLAPGPPVPLG